MYEPLSSSFAGSLVARDTNQLKKDRAKDSKRIWQIDGKAAVSHSMEYSRLPFDATFGLKENALGTLDQRLDYFRKYGLI